MLTTFPQSRYLIFLKLELDILIHMFWAGSLLRLSRYDSRDSGLSAQLPVHNDLPKCPAFKTDVLSIRISQVPATQTLVLDFKDSGLWSQHIYTHYEGITLAILSQARDPEVQPNED